MFEVLSSLFNFAATLAREARYADISSANGFQLACQSFQQASWVFEQLILHVEKLADDERSVDFQNYTLTMNSYLCLGNAQALYLKKAKQENASLEIQSRIAKQASVFFERAFEASQLNANLMRHNNG